MNCDYGIIKYPYYANGGKYRKPGLRNKRRKYWASLRLAEFIRSERKRKEEERAQRELENMARIAERELSESYREFSENYN